MIISETKISILEEIFYKNKKLSNYNNNIKLIVGLGNPEKKYDETYHNIGFMFVDNLAKKQNIKINKKECKSLIGEFSITKEQSVVDSHTGKIETKSATKKIIIAKPQTYMNLSGEAVVLLMKKYKIKEDEILIVLDDIDLDIGTYRYRERGSAGTHNGLRNIVKMLKSENFKRIRIGIGKDEKIDIANYVLLKISHENKEKINEAIERSIDHLMTLL